MTHTLPSIAEKVRKLTTQDQHKFKVPTSDLPSQENNEFRIQIENNNGETYHMIQMFRGRLFIQLMFYEMSKSFKKEILALKIPVNPEEDIRIERTNGMTSADFLKTHPNDEILTRYKGRAIQNIEAIGEALKFIP